MVTASAGQPLSPERPRAAATSLVIRALTLDGRPVARELACNFDMQGGTIGRAEDSTLPLPDPQRYISRRQADVHFDASTRVWMIDNIGRSNQILVNDHRLAPGEGVALVDGDTLQMGGYRLEVVISTDAPIATAQRDSRGLAGDVAPSPPLARHERLCNEDVVVPPDPLDLIRANGVSRASEALDQLLNGANGDDRVLQRFLAPRDAAIDPGVRPAGEPNHVSPLDLLKPAPHASTGNGTGDETAWPLPDHTPALHAPMPLPRALAMEASPERMPEPAPEPSARVGKAPAPAAAPSAATGEADAAALWAAFCSGAGVGINPPDGAGLTPQTMQLIGSLLHHFVDGTVRLARLRAETKHGLRFAATLLLSHGNNPLRYSPNAEAALAQLLRPPLPGFLPAADAARETMDDLCGHAIGTMAGMRAAIKGVVGHFEPARLEAGLVDAHVLDTLLPGHRDARLWQLYLRHFETLRLAAEDDFDRLFGDNFIEAYERQLDDLDRARRDQRADAERTSPR